MSMQQWDKLISPFLQILERREGWLAQDAINIANHVMVMAQAVHELPAKPEFETRAIAGLVEAERILLSALESVRHTKQLYHEKPLYVQAAE